MAKSWLVDGRAIARKVKTSGLPLAHQIKDCGVNWECPQCHCRIDNSDVSLEWPGLPIGVKFEPSDVELLEHLAAKCGMGIEKPHQFIDEFIPTLDAEEGICYKHPENLPGARKDGTNFHFFYRTTNAYTTGQRKRRKIHNESSLSKDVRWHKTGKTKAVMQNGVQIGCKKIMVLYGASVGGSKPCKLNWVMHQYHLGTDEEEKEGQYVVSKIFYQPEKIDTCPRTPKTEAPVTPRQGKSVSHEDVTSDHALQSPAQDFGCVEQKHLHSDDMEFPVWEDDSEAINLDAFDDSLFCNENLDTLCGSSVRANDAPGTARGASFGVDDDLENLDLGTPPDFDLADLQFSSQDSVFGWINWL